ncbi:OmpA family protein [Cellulophaga sp. HaHa_2_1]|uniref:OmpA family protein n=1 Tax=Cellulophaga sp. HaHa_2_1 TaxID=2749994 RepID=UPI001C4F9270|nr:OmpA family protein [Cellulophaga sp. HaHa_2_1]QXP50491.1 OmpA family protein [Cellulophaga sp. HaHa_2_1]
MKTLFVILIIVFAFFTNTTNAQLLKRLGKSAERAAKRTVERRVEEESSKKTDQVLDTIFDGKKGKKNKNNKGNDSGITIPGIPQDNQTSTNQNNTNENLNVYSNFDFVPGYNILVSDDFSIDNLGDFPSKWNTNGTGELVVIDTEKWLKIAGKSVYIPDLPTNLPDDFTVEFDMLTQVDQKTSSQAKLEIWLEDNNLFHTAKDMARIEIPLCLFINIGFTIENKVSGKRVIRNTVEKDIRNILLNKNHISIAVNKTRFRMWVNENKAIDVPRLIPDNIISFKLHPRDIRDGIDHVFINNIKIAQGGSDLRNQLLEHGKYSTTGILFNSGSDNIKPESYGVLQQLAEALQNDITLKLKIIGHTDTDGNKTHNLHLSKNRAIAVKTALSTQFNIDENRLQTEGKGDTQPVDNNDTTKGKANNRRVEFIKI